MRHLDPLAHAAEETDESTRLAISGLALLFGLQAAITSMDPHYHNLSPNNSMMQHVFEGLIRRDENQKLVPGLFVESAFPASMQKSLVGAKAG